MRAASPWMAGVRRCIMTEHGNNAQTNDALAAVRIDHEKTRPHTFEVVALAHGHLYNNRKRQETKR